MNKELADHEQREFALATLLKIEDLWGCTTPNKKILEGLELAKELINTDEDQYNEGVEDGKDLVRNELEPIIRALVKEIKERGQREVGGYSLEYIEGRLTL